MTVRYMYVTHRRQMAHSLRMEAFAYLQLHLPAVALEVQRMGVLYHGMMLLGLHKGLEGVSFDAVQGSIRIGIDFLERQGYAVSEVSEGAIVAEVLERLQKKFLGKTFEQRRLGLIRWALDGVRIVAAREVPDFLKSLAWRIDTFVISEANRALRFSQLLTLRELGFKYVDRVLSPFHQRILSKYKKFRQPDGTYRDVCDDLVDKNPWSILNLLRWDLARDAHPYCLCTFRGQAKV